MGTAFSSVGRMNLKNAKFAKDPRPIDEKCTCPVCTGGYPRALIRHMVTQKEMLGGILLSQAQHLFPARPHAPRASGHHRRPLRRVPSEWMAGEGAADF